MEGCPEAREGLGHVRKESGGSRLGGGQGTHLALLHVGQALLPCLLILQADPHHEVHVVGISVGRKKTCQLLFQKEERRLEGVSPAQERQLLPFVKITEVRSVVPILSKGWDLLPHKVPDTPR